MQKLYKLAIYTFVSMFFCSYVSAASLSVSPTHSYVEVDGGQVRELTYTIGNDSQVDWRVSLEVHSFGSDGESGQQVLQAGTDFPYVSLVQEGVAVESVTVAAESSASVQVQIAPPLGIEVREYPLVVLFAAAPVETAKTSTAVLQVGTNVIVYPQTGGGDQSDIHVDLSDLSQFFDTFDQNLFHLKINNEGPTATLIHGFAQLKGEDGTVLQYWELGEDLVLGHSSRLVRGQTTGQTDWATDLALPRPLLGQYTLEVAVNSGRQEVTMAPQMTTVTFLVFPYKLTGAVAGVLVIVGVIWYVSHRARRGKTNRRAYDSRVAKMKRQRNYFK